VSLYKKFDEGSVDFKNEEFNYENIIKFFERNRFPKVINFNTIYKDILSEYKGTLCYLITN